MKFNIGDMAEEKIVITDELINDFARISCDYNPVHISDDYAKKTIFGRRIAHGLICEGLISSLIGNKLPGPGAIFMNIEFKFNKPVFIGDSITAKGVVSSIDQKNKIMLVDVNCFNQDNQIVLESKTKIKYFEL